MPSKKKKKESAAEDDAAGSGTDVAEAEPGAEAEAEGAEAEVVPQGRIVCALTGEHKLETDEETTLQSFIEQLHREYRVDYEDMARDVRVTCTSTDELTGKERNRSRRVSLAVYETKQPPDVENIIRVVLIARAGTKPTEENVGQLDEVLGSLAERHKAVYGLWTNGLHAAFRMRTYDDRTGQPCYENLTDFPAPNETLEELETADRRPLRVAGGDSLLRTFKRCHDYLYGNQNMGDDRAFWQLLQLIFCKIYDEQQSRRRFFVGATEANSDAGCKRISERLKDLFEKVKKEGYQDVFEGNEKIELNDQALAYIAGELGRYDFLRTDTDAKGLAYEAITSKMLKQKRGQFFTPRNVIRMMVEMCNPGPDATVLDPACGSGGFLVVTLNHVQRRLLLDEFGPEAADQPLPSERKRIEKRLKQYAAKHLHGIDVDPELRKAARMNMVMNNDGHGNIGCFNSLAYGIKERRIDEMVDFKKRGGDHNKFDFVFTNPPFGAKIPVSDRAILKEFALGHTLRRRGNEFVPEGDLLEAKVPPEILFIECCYKFLKPGTGVLAIVLPDGILGNPGERMESVRWWMLHHMELLASVDLPAETFLPQVSVQASCVFLRRRDPTELQLTAGKAPKQRPVFMAIAEKVGHGRRGDPLYVRGPDGQELEDSVERTERFEIGGKPQVKSIRRVEKKIADDLPWITAQYLNHCSGKAVEAQ